MSSPVILTVTRDVDATPGAVFDAWLDPAKAAKFLFSTPDGKMLKVEIDARVGGHALIVERRASGDAHHRLKFELIDRPRRLVFLFAADPAEEGQWTRVSIDIAAKGWGATLTLTHEMDPEWAAYENQTRKGWTMILGTLADLVGRSVGETAMIAIEKTAPGTIRLERVLDAPIDTVWRYLVDADLRARWFAGGALEPQVGGSLDLVFNHDNLSADDVPYPEKYCAHRGAVSHERVTALEAPHLLAWSWDGGKEGEARFELTAMGDKTRLVLTHSGISGPAGMANFGGGWHAHLAVLQAIFAGEPVRDFWALHARSEEAVREALGEDA